MPQHSEWPRRSVGGGKREFGHLHLDFVPANSKSRKTIDLAGGFLHAPRWQGQLTLGLCKFHRNEIANNSIERKVIVTLSGDRRGVIGEFESFSCHDSDESAFVR